MLPRLRLQTPVRLGHAPAIRDVRLSDSSAEEHQGDPIFPDIRETLTRTPGPATEARGGRLRPTRHRKTRNGGQDARSLRPGASPPAGGPRKAEKCYDKGSKERIIEVDDEVMPLDERVPVDHTKKLHPPWSPGYRVIRKIGPLNFQIEHPNRRGKVLRVHINRLKL